MPKRLAERFSGIYKLLLNKYYVDEIYNAIFVEGTIKLTEIMGSFDLRVIDGIVNLSARLTTLFSKINGWADNKIVDGAVNLVANSTIYAGGRLRLIQTGKIQTYLLIFLTGIIVMMVIRLLI
jgi:NADH-quinone oxidoreductase subunit L